MTTPHRARRPLAVAAGLALVPAIGLGALAAYAHDKAQPAAIPATTSTLPAVPPPALGTPLLSVRRAPEPLAGDRRADLAAGAGASLVASLDASSCLVLGVDDRVVTQHNADLALIPASNVKIITAAVALDVLGPGHTFTTTIVGPSPVDGVIDGDVYLVGGGDPVLSERWYTEPAEGRKRPPIHVTDVNLLADALVSAGVTRITGRVLGDGSRYDDERFPPGWADDVRASNDGAPVGALVINDSFSPNGGRSNEPTASAAAAMVRLLAERDVAVGQGAATGVAPAGTAVLATITSAPLSQLLNEMLATSDNLTAEMLVKEVGLAVAQDPSRVGGLQVFLQRLQEWGAPTAGVVLTDGSGLSRDNQLTCATLAAVLIRGSATDPVGAGLATGGQAGTTLVAEFTGDGLVGIVQGKTGTLTGVKSLSGYFSTGDGEVAYVLILNGPAAAAYQPLWGQLGAAMLIASTAPTVDAVAPGV